MRTEGLSINLATVRAQWTLREAVNETDTEGKDDDVARERLAAMLAFFEEASGCFDQVKKLPPGMMKQLAKLAEKLR